MKIKFGTDGWYGVISRECNFENLSAIAQGLATYLLEEGDPASGVVVGYDTRFLSDSYAREVARVLAGNGIRAYLSTKAVIVPAVSYSVVHLRAQAGVMITAGHQPYEYNGIKIRGSHGGPALPEMLEKIESFLDQHVRTTTADDELIIRFNPDELYFKGIANVVDLELIKKSGLKVIVDVMHGAARGYFKELLQSEKNHVLELRNSQNLSFGGNSPEPVAQNLNSLTDVLLGFGANLALAIDGDGDRLGVLDHRGQYVDAQHIFTLLLKHLVENRKLDGTVVKTFSTTQMINKLADKYRLKLEETPVGFKYISELFLQEKILLGGEESGGFGVQGHVPERDAVLAGLLLMELLAMSKLSMRELLDEIEDDIGKYVYRRLDVKLNGAKAGTYYQQLGGALLPHCSAPKEVKEIAGIPVDRVESLDGTKYCLKNGAWLLVRPSASAHETVMRYYAEGRSLEEVDRMLQAATSLGIV